ncbi:haspin like kinase domain-containing protein [Ditylenchus destructor]|nr:haspin like kinase domain-containing protein [Ditylenchus destructor]
MTELNVFYRTNEGTIERGGYTYAFDRLYVTNNTATYRCRRKVNGIECPAFIRAIQQANPKKPNERMWEKNEKTSQKIVFGKKEGRDHSHRPYSHILSPLAESWVSDQNPYMGQTISGGNFEFIPMKAPLGNKFNTLVDPQYRFHPMDINNHDDLSGYVSVGLIINLSNYATYGQHDLPADCKQKTIATMYERAPPSREDVTEFISIVKHYEKECRKPIAVHCIEGFNRTGFMICAYLIEVLGHDVTQAVTTFAKRRPNGISNEEFVDELRARYPHNVHDDEEKRRRPSWKPVRSNARSQHSLRGTIHLLAGQQELTIQNLKDDMFGICKQTEMLTWKDFLVNRKFTKIGEGTFGEIFKDQDEVVIKVIPFAVDEKAPTVNGEPMRRIRDVHAELFVTRALSELNNVRNESWTPCFLKFISGRVVKGTYPSQLLSAWDKYRKDSEQNALNERPSKYSSKDTKFLILELSNAGNDLEKFLRVPIEQNNSAVVFSIFFQVAISLAIAEDSLKMEHRNRLFYSDLAQDETLFNGADDPQGNTYRAMRDHMGSRPWNEFNRFSNNLWLHYLATKLLEKDGFVPTSAGMNSGRQIAALQHLQKVVLEHSTIAQFLKVDSVRSILTEYIGFD